MSGEFNIYKNLNDMRNTDLISKLKLSANCSQNSSFGDDEFELLLNDNNNKSPGKRTTKAKDVAPTPEKKKKSEKISKRRKSSKERSISPPLSLPKKRSKSPPLPKERSISPPLPLPKERSISPPLALLNKLRENIDNIPRSRRSINKLVAEEMAKVQQSQRGRGRQKAQNPVTRGRGRGRGVLTRNARKSLGNSDPDVEKSSGSESDSMASKTTTNTETTATDESSDGENLSIMDRFLKGKTKRHPAMRARRSYLASVAARSTNVAVVDLLESPATNTAATTTTTSRRRAGRSARNDTITIGSDDDDVAFIPPSEFFNANSKNHSGDKSLDLSFDDENPEISVKINWKGKPEAFALRKYQKFATIFQQLAEREQTGVENLVFNLNNRIIKPDDSPDSIDYKVFQFINGRALSKRFDISPAGATKKRNINKINLKIQSDKWKKPLQIEIMKTDKFRVLYIKCAEELKVKIDDIKLSFDGELLESTATPQDLELEGGEAIDLRIKS